MIWKMEEGYRRIMERERWGRGRWIVKRERRGRGRWMMERERGMMMRKRDDLTRVDQDKQFYGKHLDGEWG